MDMYNTKLPKDILRLIFHMAVKDVSNFGLKWNVEYALFILVKIRNTCSWTRSDIVINILWEILITARGKIDQWLMSYFVGELILTEPGVYKYTENIVGNIKIKGNDIYLDMNKFTHSVFKGVGILVAGTESTPITGCVVTNGTIKIYYVKNKTTATHGLKAEHIFLCQFNKFTWTFEEIGVPNLKIKKDIISNDKNNIKSYHNPIVRKREKFKSYRKPKKNWDKYHQLPTRFKQNYR